jgi:hypothetical protein
VAAEIASSSFGPTTSLLRNTGFIRSGIGVAVRPPRCCPAGSRQSLRSGRQALRREIASAEHPGTAMRWLTNPSITPVLAGLAAGRIPLTHQALDALPQTQALAHLRHTLVAVGALPGRDEEMTRLEAFLAGLIDSQPGAERRRRLHRYLIWHQVRRLSSRNKGRPGLQWAFGAEPRTGKVFYVLPDGQAWFANSTIGLWLRTLHHYGLHVSQSPVLHDPTKTKTTHWPNFASSRKSSRRSTRLPFAGYHGFIWPEFLER